MSAITMHSLLRNGRLTIAGKPARQLGNHRLCRIVGQPRNFWLRVQAQLDREPQCLYQGFSQFNQAVTVIQIPDDPVDPKHGELAGSRILLLDVTGNLHSVYHPTRVLTGNYWDILSALPSLISPGPIGLLGLGAGTIPRIIDAHYPTPAATSAPGGGPGGCWVVHGWELDPGVVMAGRLHLGMGELERRGSLVAHTGDALAPSAAVPGGFSGIIVDLFAGGSLLPQLTKRPTWECIRSRLAPAPSGSESGYGSGSVPRVLANLGQCPPAVLGMRWQPEAYTTLRAFEAMEAAFEGEVSLLRSGDNLLALTGPQPGPREWPGALPPGLGPLGEKAGPWLRDMYPLQSQAVPLSLF